MSNEKIFIISDTHFCHKNILEYENRPFTDLADMTEQLIKNWNEVVSKNDIVIHLGDFGMCNKQKATEILSRLNGYKILVKGNHDNHSDVWFLDAGFQTVKRSLVILTEDYKKVLLTHRPGQQPESVKKGDYDYHLYGHVHGKGNEPDLYPTIAHNGACMCVERWNYKPVLLDDVLALCDKSELIFNENQEIKN